MRDFYLSILDAASLFLLYLQTLPPSNRNLTLAQTVPACTLVPLLLVSSLPVATGRCQVAGSTSTASEVKVSRSTRAQILEATSILTARPLKLALSLHSCFGKQRTRLRNSGQAPLRVPRPRAAMLGYLRVLQAGHRSTPTPSVVLGLKKIMFSICIYHIL